MTDTEALARNRYHLIVGVQIVATAGAVFGLVLAGRAQNWEHSVLGGAIIVAALYVIAVVPRALARRWRTPPEA